MRKSQKSALRLSLCFLLVVSLSLSLFSCIPIASDYMTSYLDEYDLPDFDKSKLREVERVFMNYYVEDLGDPVDMARETAKFYLEHYHEIIDTTDSVAVTEALIISYIESFADRYTIYRSAPEYAEYDTEMSGTYYGIGVLVTRSEDDVITVIEVYEESGAEAAGILAGDVIVAVAGKEVKEVGYETAVDLIRGEEHTKVDVTVLRDGARVNLEVERKRIVEKSVKYSIDENKIGYVEISSFKDNTDELFKDAIDALEAAGAVGIIYDLRGNLGGYLTSVINALSYIAPDGATLATFSDNYAKERKDNDPHELSIPAVVICDYDTASAGELFTAAMRDFEAVYNHIDVTLVGENTRGKGVMQTTVTLSDESTITLTVAYYNPPSGENYHLSGIRPDVYLDVDATPDEYLERAYEEMNKLLTPAA